MFYIFHPDLSLAFEGLALTADSGQTLITYTAEPGSASHQALRFLASWATSAAAVPEVASEEHPA